MAISRDKKQTLVAELTDLFKDAKLAVGAVYSGLGVAELQALRKDARAANVTIKVTKNRLVKIALQQTEKYKNVDEPSLTGQLLYAFSSDDEVAPAQVLNSFAKKHPELKLVVGFDALGAMLDEATINQLANLPTKDQLRGQLVGLLAAPLTGILNTLNGTQRGLAQVLAERAKAL